MKQFFITIGIKAVMLATDLFIISKLNSMLISNDICIKTIIGCYLINKTLQRFNSFKVSVDVRQHSIDIKSLDSTLQYLLYGYMASLIF